MRPVRLSVSGDRATAYAADFPANSEAGHNRPAHTRLILIHKDAHQPLTVTLRTHGHATLWSLDAPSLHAISHVTLAGTSLDGPTLGQHPFHPKHTQHLTPSHGTLALTLPPASAAALFCSEKVS